MFVKKKTAKIFIDQTPRKSSFICMLSLYAYLAQTMNICRTMSKKNEYVSGEGRAYMCMYYVYNPLKFLY